MPPTRYEQELEAELNAYIQQGIRNFELSLLHHADFDQWLANRAAPGTAQPPKPSTSSKDTTTSPPTSRRTP